jgi:hypothetical protein
MRLIRFFLVSVVLIGGVALRAAEDLASLTLAEAAARIRAGTVTSVPGSMSTTPSSTPSSP